MRYKKQICLFFSLVFLSFFSLNCSSKRNGNPVTGSGITETGDITSVLNLRPANLRFQDDFETEQGWVMDEEIVGGHHCYLSGIGEKMRSTDIAYGGSYSLRLWANKAGVAGYSNHIIAGKKISSSGVTGVWQYETDAYVPAGEFSHGQTGPEFAAHNTRLVAPGDYRTFTAGIVHRRGVGDVDWKNWEWAVWDNARWVRFSTTPALQEDQWYHLTVKFDYNKNRYLQFSVKGGGVDVTFDMRAYTIAGESKWGEESYVVSVENQNLWQDCDTSTNVYTYKVYYDNVRLVSR